MTYKSHKLVISELCFAIKSYPLVFIFIVLSGANSCQSVKWQYLGAYTVVGKATKTGSVVVCGCSAQTKQTRMAIVPY